MNLNLIDLAYDESSIVKTILSSGDYFPGFYRYTMGDKNYQEGQLSPRGLLRAYMEQEVKGTEYLRSQWTSTTATHHQSLDGRNASRSDYAVYELIKERYLEWMTQAERYDIALVEIDNTITEIEEETTYFFMGSLIRFSCGYMTIDYDAVSGWASYMYDAPFEETKEYINSIYGDAIKDFFLPAEVVAHLRFYYSDIGNLHMTDETYNRVLMAHDNSIVIASNHDVSFDLPIRWAKDIVLSEVCGE